MKRPEVSVVMPFAGEEAEAKAALERLLALDRGAGDELILADNSGVVAPAPGVRVVAATGEHSPAHARNAGAEHARNDWILFLDADCRPQPDLLDAYFREPVAEDVGALAGEVVPRPDAGTLAGRYGAARNFLSQEAHLAHPFRARAVAANLLVRRVAFEQTSGFYEGVHAAEDTDFSWRLQQLGWRLELRLGARVEHRYRASVSDLRRQWRGYAAGRAWLARRYQGFAPEPAAARAFARARRGLASRQAERPRASHRVQSRQPSGRLERGRFLALDAVLAFDELAGFLLSNRPAERREAEGDADADAEVVVVVVAERFPAPEDPLVEFVRTLEGARVEASARPQTVDVDVARSLTIDYREDDGAAARATALAALLARHPLRCALDAARRPRGAPRLAALAPAVRRLQRNPDARVHGVGGLEVRATAGRIAKLAGRALDAEQGARGATARRERSR